jgi:hypothetical protein
MKIQDKEIRSVGLNIENGGEILDDSQGLEGFTEFFEEGEVVSFEEGLKDLKEYVLSEPGQVEIGMGSVFWKEIEERLLAIKEEVGDEGVWKTWGVEYDYSLGVEI